MSVDFIVLAAGNSSRMRSSLPKFFHTIAGKPIIRYIIDTINDCNPQTTIVVTKDKIKNSEHFSDVTVKIQSEPLGTADAVKCADIGAKAIIVSHHHGRLPYAVPPMYILPRIKEALKGRDVKIIVDCSIETGADVFKAIALGADAAAVGRSMLPYLEKDWIVYEEEQQN